MHKNEKSIPIFAKEINEPQENNFPRNLTNGANTKALKSVVSHTWWLLHAAHALASPSPAVTEGEGETGEWQEGRTRTRWHDSLPNFFLKMKGFKRSIEHTRRNSFLIFMGLNSKFHNFHNSFLLY